MRARECALGPKVEAEFGGEVVNREVGKVLAGAVGIAARFVLPTEVVPVEPGGEVRRVIARSRIATPGR